MKKSLMSLLLIFLSSIFTLNAFAWDHSVDLGYGYSQDPNFSKYNNSGFLLTSDLYSFSKSKRAHWSIAGALGQWYTTAPHNKYLTTLALTVAVRAYMFRFSRNNYPVYFLGSLGPAFMTSRKFGRNKQGSDFSFQTNLGFGAEFNHFDINLRLEHFSNAHLARPNKGFNILYLLSLGYLF